MFVHIFSRDTMPLFNLFKNCLYYWGFYGLFCGYMLFNESYYERQTLKPLRYFFIAFFISAEIKNLKCHLILREIKVTSKGRKYIPNHLLFPQAIPWVFPLIEFDSNQHISNDISFYFLHYYLNSFLLL